MLIKITIYYYELAGVYFRIFENAQQSPDPALPTPLAETVLRLLDHIGTSAPILAPLHGRARPSDEFNEKIP